MSQMDGSASSTEQMVPFRSPARFLADLDPETTSRIIASAADVALIVDRGVIRDVALGSGDLVREGYERSWRGQSWIDTVTVESRPKIEDLLRVSPRSSARWRQVNHPSAAGVDVPVKYTAVQVRGEDRIVALGRDLRSISRLQHRLVEAHQSLERDYSRLRETEARYRLLFRAVSQAILIVDPDTLRIEDLNPAAAEALDASMDALVGTSLDELFSEESRRRVSRAVAEAASLGEATSESLHLRGRGTGRLAASAFRADDGVRVIVRLDVQLARARQTVDPLKGALLTVLEELPDGLIVVGSDLRILAANRAFLEMVQLVGRGQMVGVRLADFLGRSSTELNVLISNLKNHGVVRSFATVLRDRFGTAEEVEVSAVAAPFEGSTAYGFSVRSVARRLRSAARGGEGLPASAQQLTGLVGRRPLREIVRDSTDFIEKLCIEAALELAGDNRASAAEMLGLSRQGLYSKLKRFGIDETQ